MGAAGTRLEGMEPFEGTEGTPVPRHGMAADLLRGKTIMSKAVGVLIDGEETWHAPSVAGPDYDTLCGIDANDSEVGTFGTIEPKRGQKITCVQCYGIWQGVTAMRLRESNFET